MKHYFALALLVISACDSSPTPPAAEDAQSPASPASAASPASLAYPSFEIFESSRMFAVLVGDLEQVDLGEIASTVSSVDSALTQAEEAVERHFGREASAAPSAELWPKLPEAERPLYSTVPVVFMKLAPLWDAPSWSEAQVLLANQAAKILGSISGAPDVQFQLGLDAGNRAGLEELVRWFHAIAAKPECLAAMIFTMDNGPYAGLDFTATKPLESQDVVMLDEHLELRLAKVDRAGEPCILQLLRDGKPQWARVVSGAPDGDVAEAGFTDAEPRALGPYGWHVPFFVSWPAGEEQAHLYLGPEGELRFYFLSW